MSVFHVTHAILENLSSALWIMSLSISHPFPPQHHEEEEISTSPGVSEFVSDAFDSCNINQEDLRKGMEQLVLDKKTEDGKLKGV